MKNNKGYTLPMALLIVVLFPAVLYFLALWTDRNLDFWVSYFKGQPVDVPLWLSAVVSFFFNGIIVGLNILAEIARLVI